MSKLRRNDGFIAAAARYTAIAMTLPAAVFAGWLIGKWLDSRLHTTYLYIVFLILGVIAGFYELIRQLAVDMNAPGQNKQDEK